MKRKIDCVGFEVPQNMAAFLRESFSELQHISPYDSYVEATLEQKDEVYSMDIVIKHPGGHFTAEAKGGDLKQVVDQGYKSIILQVKAWRKVRFAPESGSEPMMELAPRSKLTADARDIAPLHSPASKLNVLLVDDDIEATVPLELCLKKLGCEVMLVSTGYAAIHEMLSQDKNYDLMIMDWMMPDLDGKQTIINAQKILAGVPSFLEHWKRSQLPVVTFSSYEKNQLILPECENFKFLEHWEKPAARWQLFEKVAETLHRLKDAAA